MRLDADGVGNSSFGVGSQVLTGGTLHQPVSVDPGEIANAHLAPSPRISEHLAVRSLQSWMRSAFEIIDRADAGHAPVLELLSVARDLVAHSLDALVEPGTEFSVAAGAVKNVLRIADDPDQPGTLEARISRADKRGIVAAVSAAEQLSHMLNLPTIGDQLGALVKNAEPRFRNPGVLDPAVLVKLALLDIAGPLAERSLDLTVVVRAFEVPPALEDSLASDNRAMNSQQALFRAGLHHLGLIEQATRPQPGSMGVELPFHDETLALRSRAILLRSVWSESLDWLSRDEDSLFYQGFSTLLPCGPETFEMYREYFRRLSFPEPGDRQPDPRTVLAVLFSLQRLGKDPFKPFVLTERQLGQGPLDLLNPGGCKNIIEDVIALSKHSDIRIQEVALKFLKAVAGDDFRVKSLFARLEVQFNELPPNLRACLFSMKPVEQVLDAAQDPSNSGEVRADAARALALHHQAADPRIAALFDTWAAARLSLPLELQKFVLSRDSAGGAK